MGCDCNIHSQQKTWSYKCVHKIPVFIFHPYSSPPESKQPVRPYFASWLLKNSGWNIQGNMSRAIWALNFFLHLLKGSLKSGNTLNKSVLNISSVNLPVQSHWLYIISKILAKFWKFYKLAQGSESFDFAKEALKPMKSILASFSEPPFALLDFLRFSIFLYILS